MAGLGLILAIYSLAIPVMRSIFSRRIKKLKTRILKRDEILEKMSKNRKNTQLPLQYSDIQKDIELIEKLPYHLDIGYILSGTLFAISLLFPLFNITFPTNTFFNMMTEISTLMFGFGVISFLAVWYLMFIEFRTYTTEEFEKIKEEWQTKEEKEKIIFSGKRKDTLSDKVITLKRDSDGILRGYDKFGVRKI